MKNDVIFVIGTSGHAKSVLNVIQNQYPQTKILLFDDFKEKNSYIYGNEILGPINTLPSQLKKHNVIGIFIAVGDNWNRYQIYCKLKENCSDLRFLTVIHSSANVGNDVTFRKGTIVMPGAIIGPGSTIGEHCIVNSGAILEHDCILGNFSHIASGATLAGNVTIGAKSFIGIGARIIEKKRIGSNVVIGAGAVVLKNINDNILSYGVPAKEISIRKENEKYF